MLVHQNVIHMQKASFLQANINKSGLYPRQDFGHTAAIDIANDAMVGRLFNEQFRHRMLFEQGDTGLA